MIVAEDIWPGVEQQPATDRRDELWVPGYGLYVNTLVYTYLRLFGAREEAGRLYDRMHLFAATEAVGTGLRGLLLPTRPYFALWAFEEYGSERFDLMGNSLAVLSGLAPLNLAAELTKLVRQGKDADLGYGFNEWHQAQHGRPKGNDWRTWSVALYIYAAECVRRGRTPLFDEVREPMRAVEV